MCFRQLKCVAAGLALAALAPSVNAITYELTIGAQVVSVNGNVGSANAALLADLGLDAGSEIGARFVLDGNVEPFFYDEIGIPYVGYEAVVGGEMQFAAELPFNLALPASWGMTDGGNGNIGSFDAVSLVARTLLETDLGEMSILFGASLRNSAGTAIDSTELDPFLFTDLSLWDPLATDNSAVALLVRFPNGELAEVRSQYTLNTVRVVPVPGAAVLYCCSLAVFGSFFGRARRMGAA